MDIAAFAVLVALGVLAIVGVAFLLIPWLLETAWNHSAVALFHAPVCTFAEAFWGMILVSILSAVLLSKSK